MKVRILQLGAGITGLVCATWLEKNPKVDEIVLADKRTTPANALVERAKSDKLSVVKMDARNEADLRKLVRASDIVICSITYDLLIRVGEMAMAEGVDYVDFCLAVNSIEALDGIAEKVDDAGITYLTAIGSDPGLTDIFAKRGAEQLLDSAYEVRIRDCDCAEAPGTDFFTLWSPMEMVEEATSPAAVCRDWKIYQLPPLYRKEIYDFPEPVGPLPVYNTTHDETMLVPHYVRGIKNADFKIHVSDGFAKTCNWVRRLGMHSRKPVDVRGSTVAPLDVVAAHMPRPVDMVGKVIGYAGVVVEVLGKKDDEKAMAKLWTTMSHDEAYAISRSNATGYLVGTPAAVGVEMIISGELKDKGLIVPEQLPPKKFIERLKPKRVRVKEQIIRL